MQEVEDFALGNRYFAHFAGVGKDDVQGLVDFCGFGYVVNMNERHIFLLVYPSAGIAGFSVGFLKSMNHEKAKLITIRMGGTMVIRKRAAESG